MTASGVFSATDSTAARHSPGPSSMLGSRPTSVGASSRARPRSPPRTAPPNSHPKPATGCPPPGVAHEPVGNQPTDKAEGGRPGRSCSLGDLAGSAVSPQIDSPAVVVIGPTVPVLLRNRAAGISGGSVKSSHRPCSA
jgi:hypothetical protein